MEAIRYIFYVILGIIVTYQYLKSKTLKARLEYQTRLAEDFKKSYIQSCVRNVQLEDLLYEIVFKGNSEQEIQRLKKEAEKAIELKISLMKPKKQ